MNEAIEQRSEGWIKMRLGKPTGSQFHRILTDKGNPAPRTANTFKWQLLAERIFGVPFGPKLDRIPAVKWGVANEDLARTALAAMLRYPIKPGGFLLSQDRRYGCSPDGFVGEDPVEIKCPQPPGQLENLMSAPRDHWPQLQGHLLITGRDQVHFWSWHPCMPAAYFLVPRDNAFCNTLHYHLTLFSQDLDASETELRAKGKFDIEAFLALREEDAANNPE